MCQIEDGTPFTSTRENADFLSMAAKLATQLSFNFFIFSCQAFLPFRQRSPGSIRRLLRTVSQMSMPQCISSVKSLSSNTVFHTSLGNHGSMHDMESQQSPAILQNHGHLCLEWKWKESSMKEWNSSPLWNGNWWGAVNFLSHFQSVLCHCYKESSLFTSQFGTSKTSSMRRSRRKTDNKTTARGRYSGFSMTVLHSQGAPYILLLIETRAPCRSPT